VGVGVDQHRGCQVQGFRVQGSRRPANRQKRITEDTEERRGHREMRCSVEAIGRGMGWLR
jgi:hypothetical protein